MKKSVIVPSKGRIKAIGVEVYWDAELTQPAIEIDWAMLGPGEVKPVTVYILSTGKSNIDATLTMTTDKWVPVEASGFISLSWDKEGSMLSPSQSVEAILRLTVSPDIEDITAFAFNITITASG